MICACLHPARGIGFKSWNQLPPLDKQMKRPFEFQTAAFQVRLILEGRREELLAWLCWNDPNGCYTDADSIAEGYEPLSLESEKAIMREQVDHR